MPTLKKIERKGFKGVAWQILGPSFLGTFNRKVDSTLLDDIHAYRDNNNDAQIRSKSIEDVDQLVYVNQCIQNGLTPSQQAKIVAKKHKTSTFMLYSIIVYFSVLIFGGLWWMVTGNNQSYLMIIMGCCTLQSLKLFMRYALQAKQIYVGAIIKNHVMRSNYRNYFPLNGPVYHRSKLVFSPTPFIGEFYSQLIQLENEASRK